MIHRFGGFELDEGRFELRRDGAAVRLEPRALDLLLHLARNPGRVISKEELVREVWHGKFVSDSAVTYAVAEARRALAGSAGDGPMAAIATVHGRGYRFVAEIVTVAEALPAATIAKHPEPFEPTAPLAPSTPDRPPDPEPEAPPAPVALRKPRRAQLALVALGVLVLGGIAATLLRNGKGEAATPRRVHAALVTIVLAAPEIPEGDVELHLLAVSLLDSLRARLTHVEGLRVLADADPQIVASSPRLTLALASDPRGDRGQLRVFLDDPVGALRPAGRFPIGRYDVPFLSAGRDLERFNAVREEIARRLVEFLLPAVELQPARPGLSPRDPEAYRLYLLAQDRIAATTCDNETYVAMLRASLTRDENFAPAWEVLGWEEYGLVAFCGGDKAHYASALHAADRALYLVPDWAPAVLLKMSVLNENGRWLEAWKAIDAAAALGLPPGVAEYARSYLLDYVGDVPAAVAHLDRSLAADPLFLSSQGWAPNALLYARQEERYLALLPAATSPFMRFLRGVALVRLGRTAEAREILQPAFASNPDDLYAKFSEALLLILDGDREGAITILHALDDQRRRLGGTDGETTFWLAGLYARAGDDARTLDTLDLALAQGFACEACAARDPAFFHLQRSARLEALRTQAREEARRRLREASLAP